MRKLALFILVCALGIYLVPEARTWLAHLTEPVWMPVVKWNAREEMKQVGRDVVNHEITMGQLPSRRDWGEWLDWRYPIDDLKLDAWGSPYQLRVWADSVAVISWGPDRKGRTEDDFQVATPRERRRGR